MTKPTNHAPGTKRAPRVLPLPGRLAYRALQQCLTLDITHFMVLDKQHLASPCQFEENVEFRVLSESNIRALAWEPENGFESEMASRIIFGRDVCVAAFVDGELAAYAWYALDSIEAEHNRGRSPHSGTAVSFPSDAAFLYKGYTLPTFRGRGLYGGIHRHALDVLTERGVTRIYATADWANKAALKSCYKTGFQYLGRIYRYGCGPLVAGTYPRSARRLGVQLGRRAKVHPRFETPAAIWSKRVAVVRSY